MKKTTTTRKYDEEGRLTEEIVVEETVPDYNPVYPWWQQHWPNPITWTDTKITYT